MNIVQFWNSAEIPNEIQELISSWSTLNPAENHRVFDSASAQEFVARNYSADVASAFRDITIPAMSCDVFRVAYLLKEGGIYIDCGSRCLQPICDWGIDSSNILMLSGSSEVECQS
jgi:mannosyltransferase OCH1-like enzyme